MKSLHTALSLLFLCCVITACDVNENEADCLVEMKLTFRLPKGEAGRAGAEMSSLSVFAFDANNRFVKRWDEKEPGRLGEDYTITLLLLPGTYSFVAWGGLGDTRYYLSAPGMALGQSVAPKPGITSKDELLLRLKCDTRNFYVSQANVVDYVPTPLFFGQTEQIDIAKGAGSNATVNLTLNSKKINLTITGLDAVGAADGTQGDIAVFMETPNGGYNFKNEFEQPLTMYTWTQHVVEQGRADARVSTFHTLRMIYDNPCLLSIFNKSKAQVVYTADLLEDYIRKMPSFQTQAAVDAAREFDIRIDIQASLGVVVTVNGWMLGVSGEIIQ